MKTIKFKLIKFEKVLVFQVLENKLTNTDDHILYRNGVFRIFNDNMLENSSTKIGTVGMVLGSSSNRKISTCEFNNNEDRDYYFDLYMAALKTIAINNPSR